MKWNFTIRVKKTADDMFRELGYEKSLETSVEIDYTNKRHSKIIILKELKTVSSFFDGDESGICFEEVLACAQLIKEMEAQNK